MDENHIFPAQDNNNFDSSFTEESMRIEEICSQCRQALSNDGTGLNSWHGLVPQDNRGVLCNVSVHNT